MTEEQLPFAEVEYEVRDHEGYGHFQRARLWYPVRGIQGDLAQAAGQPTVVVGPWGRLSAAAFNTGARLIIKVHWGEPRCISTQASGRPHEDPVVDGGANEFVHRCENSTVRHERDHECRCGATWTDAEARR